MKLAFENPDTAEMLAKDLVNVYSSDNSQRKVRLEGSKC